MPSRSSRSSPASLTSLNEPTGSASRTAMRRTITTMSRIGADVRLAARRPVRDQPADPADGQPLQDLGRPDADRVRAPEADGDQGGHPLLRRRERGPRAVADQGVLADG